MTIETQVISAVSLLIALSTAVYTVTKKAGEDYVRQLERRIAELERQDLTCKERLVTCQERIASIEYLNQDLLLRLSGLRPLGNPPTN